MELTPKSQKKEAFWGQSTVVKEQFEGTLRPDYIIPFKVDKKSANGEPFN